jgi:hypothetical protein
MRARDWPEIRRPRQPYHVGPIRDTTRTDDAGEGEPVEPRRPPHCGPYVVEWQIEDTPSQKEEAYV